MAIDTLDNYQQKGTKFIWLNLPVAIRHVPAVACLYSLGGAARCVKHLRASRRHCFTVEQLVIMQQVTPWAHPSGASASLGRISLEHGVVIESYIASNATLADLPLDHCRMSLQQYQRRGALLEMSACNSCRNQRWI